MNAAEQVQARLLDLLGLAARGLQILPEPLDGLGILALRGEQHTPVVPVQVHEHADVVVALGAAGLVHAEGRHAREVRLATGLVNGVL
jgi:hypothetical protein